MEKQVFAVEGRICRRVCRTLVAVLCCLGWMVTAWPSAAEEPSVAELVRRSLEARGGVDRWQALRSMVLRGQFNTFSSGKPFVLYRQTPNLYRFEHHYNDWPVTVGFDGRTAWKLDASIFAETDWAMEAPLPIAAAIAADAELGGPLVDYQARGHVVELIGREDLEGIDTYHLRVTPARAKPESWYLDAQTYLPVARKSSTFELGQFYEQWTYFDDYREMDGISIARVVEIEFGSRYQRMDVESVELDAEIDPRLFQLRPPEAMDPLQLLAGEWHVKVTSQRMPQMPPLEHETVSTISSLHRGALLEEEILLIASGVPRRIRRSLSFDRFRQVYRSVHFDSLTSHANVLEGRRDGDRWVFDNLETGTVWKSKGRTHHNRETLSDLTDGGFQHTWEISTDGGKTWFARIRSVYTRSSSPEEK